MNVLITGGNGYIAQSLKKGLESRYTVTSITRQDFDLTDASKTKDWFSGRQFDVVIHTAICGGSRLRLDGPAVVDSNLKMYYNLLDNRSSFVRFINIGSGAELYHTNTPYGLSKYVIRQSLLDKDDFYNIRVFAVFDEHELNTRFIKANLLRYIQGTPLQIDSNKKMDFFYMKDFVSVVTHYIGGNNLQKEFNCKYSETLYLSEIADYINQLGEYTVDIHTDMPPAAVDYIGHYTPIDMDFIGLKDGIRETYERLTCRK